MKIVDRKGFTLVEMAIVLVIIGIILAGVMKGRDIVRGSQVKQFSQQFAQKWATVAQTYYDKTGQMLLDGTPNGATVEAEDPNGAVEGSLALNSDDVMGVLESVGITPCTLIKSKLTAPVAITNMDVVADHCDDLVNVVQTTIEGEYAGTVMVQADLLTLELTLGNQDQFRNCVILYNVPTDVAQGLDTAIDGKADGESGACVGLGAEYTNGGPALLAVNGTPTLTAWADANGSGGTDRPCQTVGIIMDF